MEGPQLFFGWGFLMVLRQGGVRKISRVESSAPRHGPGSPYGWSWMKSERTLPAVIGAEYTPGPTAQITLNADLSFIVDSLPQGKVNHNVIVVGLATIATKIGSCKKCGEIRKNSKYFKNEKWNLKIKKLYFRMNGEFNEWKERFSFFFKNVFFFAFSISV
jgi:hypothetical protein